MSSPWVSTTVDAMSHCLTGFLDGSPVLNLASFVHTWMPPQADKLVFENMSKNLIGKSHPILALSVLKGEFLDTDEYPATRK